MTTHQILGLGLIITCVAAASPAYSQGRGNGNRSGGNGFGGNGFRGNTSGGGRVASPPALPANRPIDTSKFRTIAPNQAGTNAPTPFQAAPSQAGNNAPNAARSFAPSQAGVNSPGIGGGSTLNTGSRFPGFGTGFSSPTVQTQPSFQQTFASQSLTTPSISNFSAPSSGRSASDFGFTGGQTSGSSIGTPRFSSATQQTAFSPVRPPLAQPSFSQSPIRIILPKNYPLGVNYVLNEWTFAMQPGQQQRFAEDREWVLKFDRGLNQGTQEYALSPGTYAFVCGSTTGWELYRVSDQHASLALAR